MRKNFSGFAQILVVLLFLIGVGALGLYYVSIRNSQPVSFLSTSSPISITTPLSTSTPDPTANWKIYNNKYGFSVKYPPDWVEKLKCEGGTPEDDYICFLSPDFKESPAGAVMGSTENGSLILIEMRKNKRLVGLPFKGFCGPSETANVTDCKRIRVDGLEAWERELNNTQEQVGIIKGGVYISESEAIYNAGSRDKTLTTFYQILSTFRFLK